MGQQNFMPRGFRKLNKNHVPIVANIFIAVISLVLLFALSENWLDDLFTIMAIGISVLYFMTCICSLKLNSRNDEEWQKRPWKVPGGNLTRFASIISSFLMIIGSAYAMTPGAWRMLGIYIGIGIVIYAGMKYQWKSNQDLQPWTPDVSWAEENERLMEQSLINDNETHSI
jgi:amino acid transporter